MASKPTPDYSLLIAIFGLPMLLCWFFWFVMGSFWSGIILGAIFFFHLATNLK